MGARLPTDQQLRSVINALPTTAWTTRPDGTVDFLNQRYLEYTGLSLDEALVEPTATVHPDDLPGVITRWAASLATGEPFDAEMRVRAANGEYRWFRARTAPLRDARGKILKWCGASYEIEDAKRAQPDRKALARLSAREREVLMMLAEGQSMTRIALRLRLSRKTVETFRLRAMKKLKLSSLTALVKFALKHGLIALE